MRFLKRSVLIASAVCLVAAGFAGAYAENDTTTLVTPGDREAASNRQVHPFSEETVESSFDLVGFSKVAQSDSIELWFNREVGTLRIKNLQTGYIWGALPLSDAEGLNKTWNGYGNSIVGIECFDASGSVSRLSFGKDAEVTYEQVENGLLCNALFESVGIRFSAKIEVDENKISFSILEGTLEERIDGSEYMLKSMTFLPYLGASLNDSIDGYIFIPDGCGALIRFRNAMNYSSTYAARVFGSDLGLETSASSTKYYMKDEPQVYMPVYGVVHGARQNAIFGVIESGVEYASIVATPALTNNPYNCVSARFEFREKYVKNINRKEGAGAVVPQDQINEMTPKLSLYVLSNDQANYDGMAVLYRSVLTQEGTLPSLTAETGGAPLLVEVLGADKQDGFFGKREKTFTTVQQARSIAERLTENDIDRLIMVYRCYAKNNEAGKDLLNRVGAEADFDLLRQYLGQNGGTLEFRIDPISANEDQIHLRTEAANTLSGTEIVTELIDDGAMYPDIYYYRLKGAVERATAAYDNDAYAQSFALDGASHLLYSDFTSDHETTRSQNMESSIQIAKLLSAGDRMAMYQPNEYLWQYVDAAYDVPVNSGQYLYESDTVPFLQIVLSGGVQTFVFPMNIGMYSQAQFLRLIEYGVMPSFIVTACESIELEHTAQEACYSTSFDDWEAQMLEAYSYVSAALNEIGNGKIVAHTCLADGLIRVTYDNGVSVYVNYTGVEQAVDGLLVGANGYAISKGN